MIISKNLKFVFPDTTRKAGKIDNNVGGDP